MAAFLEAIRSCDGCTLCCKVFRIETLQKAAGSWCPHCKVGNGCAIYEDRPPECRGFQCGYLCEPELDERWKPSVAKFFLWTEPGNQRLAIHVDPQRPDAWRREPYYSSIKQWAVEAVASGSQVAVFVGMHIWVILPDRDVDLGICSPGELTVTTKTATPGGVRYDAFKISSDDPRASNFAPPTFSMTAVVAGATREEPTTGRTR